MRSLTLRFRGFNSLGSCVNRASNSPNVRSYTPNPFSSTLPNIHVCVLNVNLSNIHLSKSLITTKISHVLRGLFVRTPIASWEMFRCEGGLGARNTPVPEAPFAHMVESLWRYSVHRVQIISGSPSPTGARATRASTPLAWAKRTPVLPIRVSGSPRALVITFHTAWMRTSMDVGMNA